MTPNIVRISRIDFIRLTDVISPNVTFSNLVMTTIPRMNKGGREGRNQFFGKVKKHTNTRVLVGMEYEKRMKKKNPDFVLGVNNVFDQHLNPFVGHSTKNQKYYLKYEWFEEVPPKSEYTFEGNPIDKVLFQDWLVKSGEREINYQVVNINNLEEITLDHTKYVLEGEC